MKRVLVTGGLGFIGSHTTIQLVQNGYEVIIVDNLSNSTIDVLGKLEYLTNTSIPFYKVDLRDLEDTKKIFKEHQIDVIIHFAGFKAVGESVSIPIDYYDNNINSTINLLKCMNEFDVSHFVFSSSATVYGDPQYCPIDENHPTSATNPYGRTKLFIEEILKDYTVAEKEASVSILRYFNPVGAHKSGLIGENPNGIPNNLVPYISQVAAGKRDILPVFGDDYDTPDGTGVRDYIHVEDLAFGHIQAMKYISDKHGYFVHNLGTGRGYSVLEMIETYKQVSNQNVPYKIVDRRPGDIAKCYAETTKAKNELNWVATRELSDMLEDSWRFESNNKQM